MYTKNDLAQSRWREEITPDAEYPLHTYITRGTKLVAYIQRGTSVVHQFKKPLNSWSVTRRQFRELSKTEIESYLENIS